MMRLYRHLTLAPPLIAVLSVCSVAAAQERTDSPEVGEDVKRAESIEKKEKKDEENTDRPPKRPGIKQFDEVNVERTRPDNLPPADSRDVPDVLRGRSNKLPKPPAAERLKSTAAHVEARVFELVATENPETPGDSTTLIHRGHAVLVSQSGDEKTPPILITTYFWLKNAEDLYLVPKDSSIGGSGTSDRHGVERRTLQEVSVNGREDGWLAEHRDELVEAKLYEPDENRNLVTIVPQPVDALDLPDRGLELFDLEDSSPTRLYGYSPQTPKGLRQTKLLDSHPDEKALVYYLQTPFPAVFGAPLVSTDGRLLVLTAFKHPKDPETVLTIPPEPIAAYISEVLDNL